MEGESISGKSELRGTMRLWLTDTVSWRVISDVDGGKWVGVRV